MTLEKVLATLEGKAISRMVDERENKGDTRSETGVSVVYVTTSPIGYL